MGLKELGALLRNITGRSLSRNRNAYEIHFAKQLGYAFSGRPSQREQLVYAAELFGERRYHQSLEHLNVLWEQCADNEDRKAVLMFTALCRSRIGDTESAIRHYRSLLLIDPENSTALSNLGHLLQEEGKYAEAERYYLQALDCDGNNPYAHNNMATLYHAMGEFEKAIPFGEKSLALKGNLYQAATVLGMCHMALGDREKGSHYGQIAVANGQDPEAMKNALKHAWESQFGSIAISEDLARLMQKWKQKTAKPSNTVYVTERPAGHSRIGGPSLGEAPLDSQGKPMRLLCAIYCHEFAASPILPKEGLIRFYISEDGMFGMEHTAPNVQKNFRVLYDREFDHLAPGEDPGPSPEFPVGGCYNIYCGPVHSQAMPWVDHSFDETFESFLAENGLPWPEEDGLEIMDEVFSPEGHRIGGYPHFTQSDPRDIPAYQKYDTLLLQLDSMNIGGMHIDIGDCGVMNFFIPGENLKKLDFSDILYWWDCG